MGSYSTSKARARAKSASERSRRKQISEKKQRESYSRSKAAASASGRRTTSGRASSERRDAPSRVVSPQRPKAVPAVVDLIEEEPAMAFNIGGLLSGAVGAVQSVGQIAGTVSNIRNLFSSSSSRSGGPGVVQAGFTPAPVPPRPPVVPAQARPGPGTGGLARTLGATALQTIQVATGRRVTRNQVMAAVRGCGIDMAAATFNVPPEVICQVVIQRGTRRSRGISAADMRRTRSTLRKICSLQNQVKQVTGRRRTC